MREHGETRLYCLNAASTNVQRIVIALTGSGADLLVLVDSVVNQPAPAGWSGSLSRVLSSHSSYREPQLLVSEIR